MARDWVTMEKQKKYCFTSDLKSLKFRVAVITGVCRSGKTLFGNLLATAKYVEHTDEPWLPMNLPVTAGLKMIDSSLCREMFVSCTVELVNAMILLRQANFRKNDLSSIWKQKTKSEINHRLNDLYSRSDVRQFASQNNPLLLYNLAETIPHITFVTDIFDKCKVIHLIRKGLDVARETVDKKWFCDKQLLQPSNTLIYYGFKYKKKVWNLPWWVDSGDERKFINYSDFERGIYYWCSLIEKSIKPIGNLVKGNRYMVVRFEDFLIKPAKVIDKAMAFLEIEKTLLTKKRLKIVKASVHSNNSSFPKVSSDLVVRAEKLYEIFGYHSCPN